MTIQATTNTTTDSEWSIAVAAIARLEEEVKDVLYDEIEYALEEKGYFVPDYGFEAMRFFKFDGAAYEAAIAALDPMDSGTHPYYFIEYHLPERSEISDEFEARLTSLEQRINSASWYEMRITERLWEPYIELLNEIAGK